MTVPLRGRKGSRAGTRKRRTDHRQKLFGITEAMLQRDIYFFQEELEVRRDLGSAQLNRACRLLTLRDHR